ncbi:cyclin-D1-1 isoform X1 [Cryptomeria japonica]|uniref:cyclin-D1-1 isoform X1 n=1 Tax=Cryptomeria japonica TaxID=3369 RepID=UPI0027DA8D31|nr:cyclin-D1-1 isoform X1 [Cryptomeria japonica]
MFDAVKMDNSDSVSWLLCKEDIDRDDEVTSSSLPEDEVIARLPDFPVEDEEMISLLVQKEKEHLPREDYIERYLNLNLDLAARQEAISWMHKIQAHNNLRPLTTYLSVNYLDRFLSSYQSQQGAGYSLQLLLVACLSLAAKMEDKTRSVIDFQVGGANLDIRAGALYEMEVKILTTLKWRLFSITPFNFIHYLFFKLRGTNTVPQELISRTIVFIINTNRELNFSVDSPSSIAAAAVMCACEEVLQAESADHKEVILSCKEEIMKCYNLMHLLVRDFWSNPNKISSDTSHSPIAVEEAVETSQNTNSSKRRKISETLCPEADQP